MFVAADLAWAAGFFDGEGCFSRAGPTPHATASQAALECLDIFANVVGTGNLKGPYEKSTAQMRRKPQWIFYAYGREARMVYEMLLPWLSSYRREQAARAFRLQRPQITDFDALPLAERLAWAGGFFDGEGCFSICGEGLNARITHTDAALLRQFQSAVRFGKIYGPYKPHRTSMGKKSQYVYTVSGFERVQALLATLWINLGSAKRIKAIFILQNHLSFWRCGHRRGPKWKMHCPQCFKPGPKPGSRRRTARAEETEAMKRAHRGD